MHITALLLSFCTLTLAIPPYTPPSYETCPASTAVTRTYKTIIRTVVTTTSLAARHCPSFTTRVDTPAPWSSCAFNAASCIRPACLRLSTITQPCITDSCCTRTATDTVFAPCPTKCPQGCATSWTVAERCAGSLTSSATLTSQPTRPCYTLTVSGTQTCREDTLGCPAPDCIVLSTTTVPPGTVDGCSATPTATRVRQCSGYCHGECGTQWVTETAAAW
ncbi:uncharacterized protein M421DRAFT_161764 [Didymella exigua CBS 183.55]|uniref:Uncharacterized protein n=1 Tax=Didymella exigua CBS 183.55 TaxID=1150837 RepID=A0A6A5RHN7_9PLEO|nr:uncharacterized protein M421DRAFT_161764 [Didymella exigua CBS 183.55]KAF1927845.1 hypothetical protein M421DRAFT_161764 [Didymella exigua CBS 183.55]